MEPRVAIIGIGNCASSFLQGIEYYSKNRDGIWHEKVGGYRVNDIKVVAAFDIDKRKVNRDISDAIFSEPNVFQKLCDVKKKNVIVKPGLSFESVPPHLSKNDVVETHKEDFVNSLVESKANIILNLSSSGTEKACIGYAKLALEASCSFINCTPTSIVRRRNLVNQFYRSKLVVAGDDLMSQFGGTIFHKGLLGLMLKRGVIPTKSYQLDVGGGTETLNTIEERIKFSKRTIKTRSIASEVPYKFETVAGTTDYVDYMGNNRTSYFWIEGSMFLGSKVTIDVYLRTSDGANAGNILLDVVRAVAFSMRSGEFGCINDICSYGFKSPPKQVGFEEAYKQFKSKYLE